MLYYPEIIKQNLSLNILSLKAVDVNESTDIYTGTVDLSKENSQLSNEL
jgi:hypothetical protein